MRISNFTAGWRKEIVQVRIFSGITSLLIGIFFVLISVHAGAQGEDEITSADIALLEFLGDWGTEEGEWIDPLLFDDEASGVEPVTTEGSIADGMGADGLGEDDVWKDEEMNRGKAQNPKEEEERK